MRKMVEYKENNNSCRAHVLHIVGDPVGGVRLHVHTLLQELEGRGVCVSYAYSICAADSVFLDEISEIRSLVNAVIPLSIKKRPHWSDFKNLLSLYKYVKDYKVTIVHGHGAKGGVYSRLLSFLTQAKCVYTPHGGTAHDMFSLLEKTLYKVCEKILSFSTSYYIFESQYTKEAFSNNLGVTSTQCKIVPNGMDVEGFKVRSRENRAKLKGGCLSGLHVGVFGMLRKEKGQIYLIHAVGELLNNGFNVVLHVFGDGPDCEGLKKLVEELCISSNVYFYGDVSFVGSYMAEVDVVVIPSIFESFGYVAVEAMLLDKTVIASRVGGLVEILTEWRGGFVRPCNVSDIVDLLEDVIMGKLVLDEKKIKHMKEKASHYYSSERMLDSIMSVYKEIM